MGIWTRYSTNLDLMSRMFARTGALEDVMIGHSVLPSIRKATFRCAGCGSVSECRQWLDGETAAKDGAFPSPPAFCANAELIERLREMA